MVASILNLAGPDMIVILLIILLMFGAKRLPELARGMGKAVNEFGAARDEVDRNFAQSGRTAAPAEFLDTTSDRMPRSNQTAQLFS